MHTEDMHPDVTDNEDGSAADRDTDYLAALLAWAEEEHAKKQRGEPSEWYQSTWLRVPAIAAGTAVPELQLGCGTACCLAGKVAWDAGGRPSLIRDEDSDYVWFSTYSVDLPDGRRGVNVAEFATDRLGLTDEEAEVLFSGSNTIEDLRVLIPAIRSGEHDYVELGDLRDAARVLRWEAEKSMYQPVAQPVPLPF